MGAYINYEDVNVFKEPYLHFHSPKFYNDEIFNLLEKWIKTTDIFVDIEGGFYKQSMSPISKNNTPPELHFLFTDSFRSEILKFVESYFNTSFNDAFYITIHKLIPGQFTDIHNDYHENPHSLKYGFTHRIITYIDSEWSIEDNGLLNIYSHSEPNSFVHNFHPTGNSASGLEFSQSSFHEVSPVQNKDRFTINYTFLSKKWI